VTETPTAVTEVERVYVPGKIVVNSWGYDQTNIDYYLITKRTKNFVTLVRIGGKSTETGFMCGDCTPDPNIRLDPERYPPQRRKVLAWDGKEQGVKSEFGWCDLWDGRADHWSSYA